MLYIVAPEPVGKVKADVRNLITSYARLQNIAAQEKIPVKSLAVQAKVGAQWTLFTYRDAERTRDMRRLQDYVDRQPEQICKSDVRAIVQARERIGEDLFCIQQILNVALAKRQLAATTVRTQQRQLKAIEIGVRLLDEEYRTISAKHAQRQSDIKARIVNVDTLRRGGKSTKKEVADFLARAKAEVLERDLEAETYQERHGKLQQQLDSLGVVNVDRRDLHELRKRLNRDLDNIGSSIFMTLAGLSSLLQILDQASVLVKLGGMRFNEQAKKGKEALEVTVKELASLEIDDRHDFRVRKVTFKLER